MVFSFNDRSAAGRCAQAFVAALVSLSLTAVNPAFAEPPSSLRDERIKRDQSRSLSEEAKYTSEICGTRISATIRWESFVKRDGTLRRPYDRDCDHALSAIERVCREGKKEEVAANIKRMECGAGTKRRAVLSNGTLYYAVTDRPSNDHQFVYDFLKKKL